MNRERGFTLIEVAIAVVVLLIMVLAVLGTFTVSQQACSMGTANLSAQTTSTKCLEEIARKIRQGRLVGISADRLAIALQFPVDHDQDGDILDEHFNVEWGGNDQLGWSLRYRFEASGQFEESKIGLAGADLNHNGSRTETSTVGRILDDMFDQDGNLVESRRMTPPQILIDAADSDLDGDGNDDHVLFDRVNDSAAYDPAGCNVRIACSVTPEGCTVLTHPSSIVTVRNF